MRTDITSEAARRVALADLIQHRRQDIESRWLAAVLEHLGPRALDITELRNAMPDYLQALARELRVDPALSTDEMKGNAAWAPVAQEHAVTRVRQGFDIEELVHEFVILRRVLLQVAEEGGLGHDGEASLLADLIDAGVATSVKSYVESRDYAARQTQAEHVGFVTHELKTPLTAAHLIAEKLRAELALTESQERHSACSCETSSVFAISWMAFSSSSDSTLTG